MAMDATGGKVHVRQNIKLLQPPRGNTRADKDLPAVPSLDNHDHNNNKPGQGDFAVRQASTDWNERIPRKSKHNHFNFWAKGDSFWLWETLSCILAVVALAAIVVTLATHQGKPLPDWPSLISINSLVAIFTAIMKSAFILPVTESISELKWIWFASPRPVSDFDDFDSASRGPFGSLLLLLQRPRHLLASAGAIIMILALAVDPFTQQVLQYYSCTVATEGLVAMVPKTNIYDTAGGHTGAGRNNLDIEMSSAIYQALYDLPGSGNISQLLPIQCSTGNCTFSSTSDFTYRSVAICSNINDVTDLVTRVDPPPDIPTNQAPPNYTFADLNVIYSVGGLNVFLETHTIENLSPYVAVNTTLSSLGGFYTLMLTSECSGNKTCPITPFAFTASYYPCLNTYGNVSVSNFQLNEQLISSIPIPPSVALNVSVYDSTPAFAIVGDYPATPGIDCSPSKQSQGSKTLAAYTSLSGQPLVQYPSYPGGEVVPPDPSLAPNNQSIQYYNPQCAYAITARVYFALTQLWALNFNGLGSVNGPDGYSIQPNNNITGNSATRTQQFDSGIGDAILQVIFQNGRTNITSATKYVKGVSDAMTSIIRKQGAVGVPSNGTVFSNQTCIRVKWEWLILPIGLLALTILVFSATVVECHRYTKGGASEAGRRPWKSSALPLLWCGLQDADKMKYGKLQSVEDMTDSGKELKVSLVQKEEWTPEKYSGQRFGTRPGRWILG